MHPAFKLSIVIALTIFLSGCISAVESNLDLGQAEHYWSSEIKKAEASKDNALMEKAYYELARAYRQWGHYDKAISAYAKFLDLKESEPPETYHGLAWNQVELGNLYFDRGQWSLAIPIYQEALRRLYEYARLPDSIEALHKLAVCYWKEGDKTTAELKFQQANENYQKAVKMPTLKVRRALLDVDYALMLEDWARMLAGNSSAKKDAQAKEVWTGLAKNCNLSASASKSQILEALAKSYCAQGKQIEATILFDKLFDLFVKAGANRRAAISQVWNLQSHCLQESNAQHAPASENNPYPAKFDALNNEQQCFDNRQILCQEYAWAVPNDEAIKTLLSYQPLVEIGAGTGYWANLVRQSGGKIIAYDIQPVPSKANIWHKRAGSSWAEVLLGDETAVRAHSGETLFLCWPPETNRCAYNTLNLYKGKFLIYVGEGPGGCTGTDEFHDALKKGWQLIKQVEIPQWPGVYDMLFVYQRKNAVATTDESEKRSCENKAKAALGERLAAVAQKSKVVLGDLCSLVDHGIKIQFVSGGNRAYYNENLKTVFIAKSFTDARKLQAIAHEYAHAILNPTKDPIPGKTGRKEFITQGFEQEADAVIHELIAAHELRLAGVQLDRPTLDLLAEYQSMGRQAIFNYIEASENSATEEGYVQHFSRWYDDVIPPSKARP